MKQINRIFFTFLIAYSVLIFIPLATGIIVNKALSNEYEQHVKESHLSNLKKTQDILEGFMDNVKWSTYQLANNTQILRLISKDSNSLSNMETSLLIRDTMTELRKSMLFNASNNSIFYIYLSNKDLIITPYSVYKHSDFNTTLNFFRMEGENSTLWHNKITNIYQSGKIYPVRDTIIEDFKNKPMIPYVQSIPLNSVNNQIDGVIVYLIGEIDFLRFLDYKNLPSGGYSYISDEENNIITSISNSEMKIKPLEIEGNEGMIELVLDGEKKFIIYTTSKKNNWRYVSVLPEKWVLKNVRFFQFLSAIVMLIALIICLCLAYKISKKWSAPIVTTFKSVKDFLKKESLGNESIISLNSSINELIDKGENMQDELLSQKSFLNSSLVNGLINGFFSDEKSLEGYIAHLGFDFTENSFSAVVLTLKGEISDGTTVSFDGQNRSKNMLKVKLQQNFRYKLMISEQDNSDLVLIIFTNDSDTHIVNIESALNTLFMDIPPGFKDNLVIGLGDPVNSLMQIHRSYIQAQEIVSSVQSTNRLKIMKVGDIDKKLDHYFYPLEVESRLINSLVAGNPESVESILSLLYQENMENRLLDIKRLSAFNDNLLSSIFRVKSKLCDENKGYIDSLNKEDSLDFNSVKEIFSRICDTQNKNKKSHNNSLIEEIENYLKENFRDKNLSLNAVGDHFSITESYLSYFFKEQTGINFSTYLERLRIDEGKKQLLETSLPIHQIAENIGYNSDKTFRRVFQKTLNISPSRFRKGN